MPAIMKPIPERVAFLVGGVLLGLLAVLWIIAGSDHLFVRTVPIDQRLVSQNESIRTKAQQELLGLGGDAKKKTAMDLATRISEKDPFISKWAAIALALIGPASQETIPSLVQCVSFPEKEVAQACRVALSEIGAPDESQLPTLLQALKDERLAVRCEAAATLAKMGPSALEAIPLFVEELQTKESIPDCWIGPATALFGAHSDGLHELYSMLTSPSEMTRRHAALLLSQIGPRTSEEIQLLLQTLADDASSDVRRHMAKALGLRQPPERGLDPALAYVLRRSRLEPVRLTALDELRSRPPAPAVLEALLLGALQDSSAAVRLRTVQWVRELDLQGRFALPILVSLLNDPELTIRRQVLEIIRRIGPIKRDYLAAVARTQRDAELRCTASSILVELAAYDRISIPLLTQDLTNLGLTNSDCAADALGMAGLFNRQVPPAIIKLLQDKNREIRRRGVRAAFHLGSRGRDVVPALAQAQRDGIPGAESALRALRDALPRPRR